MTSSPPPRPVRTGRPGPPRRRRVLVPVLVVVAVVVVAASVLSAVGTEVLWYRQVGYGRVYATELATRAVLFVIGGGLMAVAVGLSMTVAYRSRPVYAPVPGPQQNLDRYREGLEPLRRVVVVVLPVLLGLFAGSAASSRWQTVLQFLHRTPFGAQDPVFHHDIGFYVFTVPFLSFVLGLLMAVVLLAGLAGAATHYLYGGLRLTGPGPRTTRTARVHLAGLAALLALLQAANYWLDRYGTLTNQRSRFDGANYVDVNVVVPVRAILAIAAVLVAVLFVLAAVRGGWRLPAVGVAALVVVAVVAGGVLPALIQSVRVRPNEQAVEAPYIQDNIDATRAAYGLGAVQENDYAPSTTPAPGALAGDAATTASIRLTDPAVVSPTFRQLQAQRNYYQFPDTLDVDRYTIDGQSQDAVVAVRELRQEGISNSSWVNLHTVYTHGYGLVAAAGNQQGAGGNPAFIEGGIPVTGELGDYEPRVYFGEFSPDFSIVGGPGDAPREIDYPDGQAEGQERRNTYAGGGGPGISNLLVRAMYAVKFRDPNILLTDAVNPQSEILYDRNPRQRVQKVAPYLTLDGDPYPSKVGDRLVWIVDGYTTSQDYPYSQSQPLDEATQDTLTTTSGAVAALPPREVNYIRNSVKATVDAYTGEVVLYAWDAKDPVLRTWTKAFPGTVKPLAEMSGELMSHVRYPEDLFKVQRAILASYHVTSAQAFYSGQDFWRVPTDPTGATTAGQQPGQARSTFQPPYYLTLQMPQQGSPSFSLTTTFIPNAQPGTGGRDVLTGFLAVDADAGSTQGTKRDGYGTLRLLQLPTSGQSISGPGQIQNDINASPEVTQALTLLRQGGASTVTNGNLLTLPVADGLLYVQPVYVQSSGGSAYPLLRYVATSFGGRVGFAPTLDEALDEVFGGDAGTPSDGSTGGGTDGGTPAPTPSPSPSGSATSGPTGGGAPLPDAVRQALQDADAAEQDGQAALARGDFAAYGEAQQRLRAALDAALAAEGQAAGAAPSATASPSASATPSPTG